MSSGVDSGILVDFPLSGDCLVLRPPGHGRWAFDVLPLDPGSGAVARGGWGRYLAGGLRAADVHGWGREVRSPLDGEVVASHDGEPDRGRLLPWRDVPATMSVRPLVRGRHLGAMAGNHVVIRGKGGYVLLAHLRQGSVRVRAGGPVRAGEVLGTIGFSGNAIGPHLHMQAMDGPDPLTATLSPFGVRSLQVWDGKGWQERNDEPLPAQRSRVRAD